MTRSPLLPLLLCPTLALACASDHDRSGDSNDELIDAQVDAQIDADDAAPTPAAASSLVADTCADGSCVQVTTCAQPAHERGLFMWEEYMLDSADPAAGDLIDELIGFAQSHAVTRIYFQAQGHLPTAAGRAKLAELIAAADAACIGVDLLLGNHSWHLPGQTGAQDLLTDAYEFVAGLGGTAVPIRVHYDVEPHANASWGAMSNAQKTTALGQLVTLYQNLQALGASLASTHAIAPIEIVATMPYWYDEKTYSASVPVGGVSRPMLEWMIDTADVITLMAYRDTYSSIRSKSVNEVTYAQAAGGTIVAGIETKCGLSSSTTFCEEGEEGTPSKPGINPVLRLVDDYFGAAAPGAWGGVFVHHAPAWMPLSSCDPEGDDCAAGQTCQVSALMSAYADHKGLAQQGWAVCVGAADPTCGDGVVQGAEECDDGNADDGDRCSNACDVQSCSSGGDVRGLWVWNDYVNLVNNSADAGALLDFARSKGVTRLFLDVWDEAAGTPMTATAAGRNLLGDFIADADARCLEVDLLIGPKTDTAYAIMEGWMDPSGNVATAIDFAEDAVALAAGLSGPKPVGIHLDIEPAHAPDKGTNMAGVVDRLIARHYQIADAFETAQSSAGTSLRLNADANVWLQHYNVTRSGTTKPGHQWLLDRLDATFMDYVDNSGDLIDYVSTEMSYAGGVSGRQVIVGVETICGLDDGDTFCEEGEATMLDALEDVAGAYVSNAAWRGTAIHYYESYADLGG